MNKKALSKGAIIVIVIIILAIVVVGFYMANSGGPSLSPPTQCNDKIDNDGDGRCDYLDFSCGNNRTSLRDLGCKDKLDDNEASCVTGSTSCGVGECRRNSTCVRDAVSCTPGASGAELCDGKDNNCNGATDDGLGSTSCGVGACRRTVDNCVNGRFQTCTPGERTTEICTDSIDNNCDGTVNDGCPANTCTDTDGGIMENIRGTVSGINNAQDYSNTDFCVNSTLVSEYYCIGSIGGGIVNVPSLGNVTCGPPLNLTTSCVNGACV